MLLEGRRDSLGSVVLSEMWRLHPNDVMSRKAQSL